MSAEDDRNIRSQYGRVTMKWLARRLCRSPESVEARALVLFPVVPAVRTTEWGEAREQRLRETLGGVPDEMLARVLCVPLVALEAKLDALRPLVHPHAWTPSEDQDLRRLYGTRTDAVLSLLLQHPEEDVRERARLLTLAKDKAWLRNQTGEGSTRMPHWTAAELNELQTLYATTDNTALAVKYGRTKKAIASAGNRLGLCKSEEHLRHMGAANRRPRRDRIGVSPSAHDLRSPL